ncbi:hypothetical protein PISMIDRAFT_39956, partial [Pisolithus microcarpus 441]
IANNPKFYPFFKDAIGAIDGTHIACVPSANKRDLMHNWKGFLSQNCLIACSFNGLITYILGGWEGSVADAMVYHNAHLWDLAIPDGCYYLTDAGFPSTLQLLVLYHGQCYYLAEWGRASLLPKNRKELFNLCH